MSRYRITLPASRDLEEISSYFAVNKVEAGTKLLRKFNQKCRQICQFPNSGRSYEEIRPGLRGLPLNGHIIFYTIIGEDIEILRVVSGKRDLRSLFEIEEE